MTVKCQTNAKNKLNATKIETRNQEPKMFQILQTRQEKTKIIISKIKNLIFKI